MRLTCEAGAMLALTMMTPDTPHQHFHGFTETWLIIMNTEKTCCRNVHLPKAFGSLRPFKPVCTTTFRGRHFVVCCTQLATFRRLHTTVHVNISSLIFVQPLSTCLHIHRLIQSFFKSVFSCLVNTRHDEKRQNSARTGSLSALIIVKCDTHKMHASDLFVQ